MPPVRRFQVGALEPPATFLESYALPKVCFIERPSRSERAEDHLKRYLETAELPGIARFDRSSPYCLPQKGRRTHKNKLKVRHNLERRIEKIRRHDTKGFNDAVTAYHKHYIYGREGRPFTGKLYTPRPEGEALVLSSSHSRCDREDTFENTPYPNNIDETCTWVVDRPLKTMQRAVHLAFPDTSRWWLEEAPTIQDADRETWRTYLWRFHPNEHHPVWWRDMPASDSGPVTEPAPHESMVFAIQPHWILGPQDLKNFTECTSLPSFSEDGTAPTDPLTSDQRVWAKLHDTCKRYDCRKFALTTYHGWVFGAFSEDWTTVQISEAKEFDANAPTVMQSLVYWVASSMGVVGAFDGLVMREDVDCDKGNQSESEVEQAVA